MKDPVLAGQLGTTMSVIQARLVEIKKKPRSVLAGMSVTEVCSVYCSECVFAIKRHKHKVQIKCEFFNCFELFCFASQES
jgi:hypothetical protein